jgi:hypothetical protein
MEKNIAEKETDSTVDGFKIRVYESLPKQPFEERLE